MMNELDKSLLEKIADLTGSTVDALNIRKDSGCAARQSTEHIEISSKTDGKEGIDIRIKDGTKGEKCYIPVIISKSGLSEMVYNDFYVGDDCDVEIVAGCGIHNSGCDESRHDGVHTFYIGKNSRVRYSEKHCGENDPGQTGQNVMNPKTEVFLGENSVIQMDTVQIRGIDSTRRETAFHCDAGSEVVVTERLLTHGKQVAQSDMVINLNGADAKGRVISRSVAQDESEQLFYPRMVGNAACFGHVQCDSIIMGQAKIQSIPAIVANCPEAQLIHEAAIGKIAGDQLLKLETLGLTPEEAENRILEGFLA
jgi:Fe-S cluster assembly scaffold protein SufB